MMDAVLDLKKIGTIRDRSAEIKTSNWTLGCEVLDRDFADYDEYKEYIPALGIKTIRLQGGWAKTEKTRGVYNFQWLDHIVDDARSRGLNILLETDYGNTLYPDGGGWDLAGGFPTSEEALAAWDRWVAAMAEHYQGRVRDWAMWNEPDLNPKHTPENIADFNIRTAETIKRIIPDARIAGLSLASIIPDYFENCIRAFERKGKLHLFDWFIYHGYQFNPDHSYSNVLEMKDILIRHHSNAKLRQGENGCPSEMPKGFALAGYPWTELSQAKWDLRRYLGDLGHDVESSVFTICDFNHIGREINRKGLLYADENHKVLRRKEVYFSIRNMASVFDDRLKRTNGNGAVISDIPSACFTYASDIGNLVLMWNHEKMPSESLQTIPAQVITNNFDIKEPVWADLRTGNVYEIPAEKIVKKGNQTIYQDMPIYDSPVLIGEKSLLM